MATPQEISDRYLKISRLRRRRKRFGTRRPKPLNP